MANPANPRQHHNELDGVAPLVEDPSPAILHQFADIQPLGHGDHIIKLDGVGPVDNRHSPD